MLNFFAPRSKMHWAALVFYTAAIINGLTLALVFWLIDNPRDVALAAIFISAVVAVPFVGFFYAMMGRLWIVSDRMRSMARTDLLTGLPNRRVFFETASRVEKSGVPYLVIILDIDHFKRINDRFGHVVGDECLKQVAEHLRKYMRDGDEVCRFGGEEFAVILPEQPVHLAQELAQRVAEGRQFETSEGLLSITFSMGIAQWQQGLSVDDVLRRADSALYDAKGGGRAQAMIFDDTDDHDALEREIARAS